MHVREHKIRLYLDLDVCRIRDYCPNGCETRVWRHSKPCLARNGFGWHRWILA